MELHDMRHLAKLSRLSLSEEEIVRMQSDIASILGYIDQIGKADVSDDDTAYDNVNQVRDDVVMPYDTENRDRVLSQATQRHEDFIQVKKVITR
jgi:aspartyl-tRNA(Asn)/glutamyl-tRNA(Gln) amidotransferase subunit C